MENQIFEGITNSKFKELFERIIKESPNNYDLGARIRKFYEGLNISSEMDINEILKNEPLS